MNLFVLKELVVKEKSEKDLKKEWLIRNIECENYVSYEDYVKYLKSWDEHKYSLSINQQYYFSSLDIVKNYVMSGTIGLDTDTNYIVIVETSLNSLYMDDSIKDIWLFKYNYNNHTFEEASFSLNDETKLILAKQSTI